MNVSLGALCYHIIYTDLTIATIRKNLVFGIDLNGPLCITASRDIVLLV